MRLHASCAARLGPDGYDAILLQGPPGAGKSDLVLRLLHHGFTLVADDQVLIEDNIASPPESLAGLLEIRGLGIFQLPHHPRRPAYASSSASACKPSACRNPNSTRNSTCR